MVGTFLVLFLIWSPAFASVHNVFPPFGIQAAVDSAAAGDTLLLHEGTFEETVVLYGKDLTIGSLFLLDGDTSHIRQTTVAGLQGQRLDTSSAFVYAYGETPRSRLIGLTITGEGGTRWSSGGGGVFCGGAVFVAYSHLTMTHCRVIGARAEKGGGMLVVGSGDWSTASARLSDCLFYGCYALLGGGGVWARSCSLLVSRCEFVRDTIPSQGGAAIRITQSAAFIDSCRFRECFTQWGAIWYSDNMGRISRCVFEGNGGAQRSTVTDLEFGDSWAPITGCVFQNNGTDHPSIIMGGTTVPLTLWGMW